ncbi:MAG: 1-acyl-sn-glycerol-3-phosphate acyltransferase [Chloroflexi bacterium]|nr:1-acyl-sn-glycerol-3-phosphate acyltransferase [Chloroflexota bacterium]
MRTEGIQHVPLSGPVIIASRHYHHLYDGVALLSAVPRPIHIIVGLDWVHSTQLRGLMEWLCHLVQWPVVLRRDRADLFAGSVSSVSAYRPQEAHRYLYEAIKLTASLLSQGRVILIFPEGYPTIDPFYTPKVSGTEILPFREGFARFVLLAQRHLAQPAPIVPCGLEYRHEQRRWSIVVRFGPPLTLQPDGQLAPFIQEVEAAVRRLSGIRMTDTVAATAASLQPASVLVG